MKVLFINTTGGFFGGVEKHIYDSILSLKKIGVVPYGLFLKVSDRIDNFFDAFEEVVVGGSNVKEDIKRINPDIIYIHKIEEPSINKIFAGRKNAIRFIHDHSLYCTREHKYFPTGRNCSLGLNPLCYLCAGFTKRANPHLSPFNVIKRKMDIKVNRKIHNIIVMSKFMKENLIKNGFREESIHIIPTYIKDFDGYKISSSSSKLKMLFVGQVIKGKGLDVVIKAMNEVKDAELTIVGSGGANSKIQKMVSHFGLDDRVKTLGWVSGDKLDNIYKSHEIVVVPSRWQEPFGMVGIESYSNSRPVITNDVGGISEWANNRSSIVVANHSVPDWVDGLKKAVKLHSENALEDMGQEGYEYVRANYNETLFLERHKKLFDSILKERRN